MARELSPEQLEALQTEFPEALTVSTKSTESMAQLRDHIIGFFEQDMSDQEIFVPYTAHGAVGPLRSKMRVLGERHSDDGTFFEVRARPETVTKLKRELELD